MNMSENQDPYFRFYGPLRDDAPKEFIPFLDTIRKKSEWIALGFHPRKTIVKKGLYFGFQQIARPDEKEIIAIKTEKKCVSDPQSILFYLDLGYTYEDFAVVSEDVKDYCDAVRLFAQG
jgi:hypothetical protein